jgi:HK97 family phage portal protein
VIVRSYGGNVELRALDDNSVFNPYAIPAPGANETTVALPSWRDAYGIPAVLYCIRLAARAAGQLPCDVYRPVGDGSEKARDAWQRDLLHRYPNGEQPPFAVWSYIVQALLGHGGIIVRKIKSNGRGGARIAALQPIAPTYSRIVRKSGKVRYYIGREEIDAAEIIYFAGDLLDDPEIGVSPLTIAREAVQNARARQRFETRFYQTDGHPAEIVTWGGDFRPTREQRSEFARDWEARHQPGTRRLGQLYGGATYQSIGLSLADAQWAESQALTTEEAALILGMPVKMINPDQDRDPANTNTRFRELFLQPILTSMEQTLANDPDLFDAAEELFPAFNTNALLRPSLKDRADAYRLLRQGGIETANELRALEDKPPHPDGDELQATPVGGAPNPDKAATSDLNA